MVGLVVPNAGAAPAERRQLSVMFSDMVDFDRTRRSARSGGLAGGAAVLSPRG